MVLATVTFKSQSGLSIFESEDLVRLSARTIAEFVPAAGVVTAAASRLQQWGFTIVAQTEVGLSFSGDAMLFKSKFGVTIDPKHEPVKLMGGCDYQLPYDAIQGSTSRDLPIPLALQSVAKIALTTPGVPFLEEVFPAPTPGYYAVQGADLPLPHLLNAASLHARPITGAGIRVSMVDSGFFVRRTRVDTTSISMSEVRLSGSPSIYKVVGVWRQSDPTGLNYYAGGALSVQGNEILIPVSSLPFPRTAVTVEYIGLHKHYMGKNYDVDVDASFAVMGDGVDMDGLGHGTAIASNLLAVAPGVKLSNVKGPNVAGFQYAAAKAAAQPTLRHVILCGWGTLGFDPQLHLEIANAVSKGVVVVFAAGNGHTDSTTAKVQAVATPDVISVGGAYPIQGGGFRTSDHASRFDSDIYIKPHRHAPDVVGLVGEQEAGILIMMPTAPGSVLDIGMAGGTRDGTAQDDGWLVASGTSAAAAQVAGVAALLLEKHPTLTPAAVRNILENTAVDITYSAAAGPSAASGWDEATGYGLVNAERAVDYLEHGTIDLFIRDTVDDSGAAPTASQELCTSPDIIVQEEKIEDAADVAARDPAVQLGPVAKHRYDLGDRAEDGQDNYVYVRVQNRGDTVPGAADGHCVTVNWFGGAIGAESSQWKNVGKILLPQVKPGEFVVAGPLTWSAADVPVAGHYCLVARIHKASEDPVVITSATFEDTVRNWNDVAWRNIEIENLVPGGESSLSFYMDGPPGSGHSGVLRVDARRFAARARIQVRLPLRLTQGATPQGLVAIRETKQYRTYQLTSSVGVLNGMPLSSREHAKGVIYFSLPEQVPDGDYSIRADMLVRGALRGSVTQVARVGNVGFFGNRVSKEVHRRGCPYLGRMAAVRKVPFAGLDRAHKLGYDNCALCIGDSKR
jgi:subtilisin family serine protease